MKRYDRHGIERPWTAAWVQWCFFVGGLALVTLVPLKLVLGGSGVEYWSSVLTLPVIGLLGIVARLGFWPPVDLGE